MSPKSSTVLLATLPAELRIEIYKHIAFAPFPVRLGITPALARTNFTFYKEVLSEFYRINTFFISQPSQLQNWFKHGIQDLVGRLSLVIESSLDYYPALGAYGLQPTKIVPGPNGKGLAVHWDMKHRIIASLAKNPRQHAILSYSELREYGEGQEISNRRRIQALPR